MTELATDVEIRQPTLEELELVRAVRHVVLDPARVVKTDCELSPGDRNPANIHMAAFVDGKPVSVVRVDTNPNGSAVVRKMATLPEEQRKGYGGRVLDAAEKAAIGRGVTTLWLESREGAIPFYERHGYVQTDEPVVSPDGMLNYPMEKVVTD